jgi:serine/threonine protein kinase
VDAEVNILRKLDIPCERVHDNWLIMPLFGREDLFEFVKDVQNFRGLRRTVRDAIIHSVIECVLALHEANIVHGDIKIENFVVKHASPNFLEKGGDIQLQIVDFGSSICVSDDEGVRLSDCVGTREYLAPEVRYSKLLGKWSDVFSVGVVVILFLTNSLTPFNYYIHEHPADVVQKLRYKIPVMHQRALERMITREPRERASMADIISTFSPADPLAIIRRLS